MNGKSCYISAMSAMSAAVRDNTARSRFELEADGVTVFMNYRITGDVISLDHTETPAAARGRGLASRLTQGVLDEVRSRGLKIVPRCPFVRAYVETHPEYRDLLT
jgi:uncharacterized protein